MVSIYHFYCTMCVLTLRLNSRTSSQYNPILITLNQCFLDDVNGKHYVVHSFKIDRLSGQIYIPSWFVYGGPPVPPSRYPPIPLGRLGIEIEGLILEKNSGPELTPHL